MADGVEKLTLDARVRPSERTLFRNIEGEAVLLSLGSQTYHGLDTVGTRIWELIVAHGCLRDVHRAMLAEFDVEEAQAESDLLRLVDELSARGLVIVE